MLLLFFFTFIAGIATVLSLCILPVLPAVLSASASGGKKRPFGVILGLIISFTFFTLALTTLVQSFLKGSKLTPLLLGWKKVIKFLAKFNFVYFKRI